MHSASSEHSFIILAGLPGTGKTTLARVLARRLRAAYVRIDSIEQAIRDCDVLKDQVGASGYYVGHRVAKDNLVLGLSVVAESVNPLAITRDAWRRVGQRTGAKVFEVELVCSDPIEHRRRVEQRESDIEDLELPTWSQVLDRHYEHWKRPHVVVDTASATVEQTVTDLLVSLGLAPDHGASLITQ